MVAICGGMVPLSWLKDKLKYMRLMRLLIWDGISPEREFASRYNEVKLVARSGGMVPEKLLWCA